MSDVTRLSRKSHAAKRIMTSAALILTLSYFLWVYYRTMKGVIESGVERSASAMVSDAPQQPPVPVAREALPPAGDARPAPTGFKDFRLGMTRREVHALLEKWPEIIIEHTREGTAISGVTYDGVARITVRFSDGMGLLKRRYPIFGRREDLVPSSDLRPDAAGEHLEQLIVELADLKGGSPEQFLEELRRQYGTPFTDVPPKSPAHALDFPDYTFRPDVGPVFVKERVAGWYWPDVDRTAIAKLTRYGEHTFGNLEMFGVVLTFVDGLGRAKVISTALENYRTWRENQKTEKTLGAFREGIGGAKPGVTKPRTGPLPPTAEELDGVDSIPEALIGCWHLRGHFLRGGEEFEGYLTLRRSSDTRLDFRTSDPRLAFGMIEWLEGPALETVAIAAVIGTDLFLKDKVPHSLLALWSDSVETGDAVSFPKGLYLAAIVREDDAWTLRAGVWEEKGVLSWRASKLPEKESATQQSTLSVSGPWQLAGDFDSGRPRWNAVCTLQEQDEQFPLRKISGTVTGRWNYLIGNSFRGSIIGSFNVRTGRLWLRATGDSGFPGDLTYDSTAYLSSDGTLTGEKVRWKGIRDELIPQIKPSWYLFLPREVDPRFWGGGQEGVQGARRFLEQVIDAFNMDLLVDPTEREDEYYLVSRGQAGHEQAITRIKDFTELPKESWLPTWDLATIDDERSRRVFFDLLRASGVPPVPVRSVSIVVPPKLVQRLKGLEQEHLQKVRNTTDTRWIERTNFAIRYNKEKNTFRLEVESMNVRRHLSW